MNWAFLSVDTVNSGIKIYKIQNQQKQKLFLKAFLMCKKKKKNQFLLPSLVCFFYTPHKTNRLVWQTMDGHSVLSVYCTLSQITQISVLENCFSIVGKHFHHQNEKWASLWEASGWYLCIQDCWMGDSGWMILKELLRLIYIVSHFLLLCTFDHSTITSLWLVKKKEPQFLRTLLKHLWEHEIVIKAYIRV